MIRPLRRFLRDSGIDVTVELSIKGKNASCNITIMKDIIYVALSGNDRTIWLAGEYRTARTAIAAVRQALRVRGLKEELEE